MADRKSILLIEDHDIVRRYYAERLRQRDGPALICFSSKPSIV
jgi:DNA-binding NarL/FixJ family response regulator